MIRKIKIYMLMMAMAFSLSSCLEKLPEDAILAGDAIKTAEDVHQAMTGIYSSFMSSSLYGGSLTLLPDLQSDFVYALKGYSNVFGDIWRWDIHGDNRDISSVYASLYNVIAQCNFLLDNAEVIRPGIKSDEDKDLLESSVGQAYLARALAYSELIKNFCKPYESDAEAQDELGVVIVTHYESDEPLVRASLKASYDQVLSDLQKAEDLLKVDEDEPRPSYQKVADNPYFTEYAVYALRARVSLYMKHYQEAIDYSSKVIDSGHFKLARTTDLGYDKMWVLDQSDEIIWKVGYTLDSYGGALGTIFFNLRFPNSVLPDYVPAVWILNSFDKQDMRPRAMFKYYRTAHIHGLEWPLLQKYFGNPMFMQKAIKHISMPKPFRLSEQYLIRAEAYAFAEQPDYAKAGKDIGAIHVCRYESASPSYPINAQNAMKVIEEERVKELYMEGFRLNDLKRWHKGFERTPQPESIENGNSLRVEADDVRFVWPIPRHELESPDGSGILPNESNR